MPVVNTTNEMARRSDFTSEFLSSSRRDILVPALDPLHDMDRRRWKPTLKLSACTLNVMTATLLMGAKRLTNVHSFAQFTASNARFDRCMQFSISCQGRKVLAHGTIFMYIYMLNNMNEVTPPEGAIKTHRTRVAQQTIALAG